MSATRSADRLQFSSITNRNREFMKRLEVMKQEMNEKITEASLMHKKVQLALALIAPCLVRIVLCQGQ